MESNGVPQRWTKFVPRWLTFVEFTFGLSLKRIEVLF